MPARSALGCLSGFCVGIFVKQLTRILAFYVGMGLVSISALNYFGYIIINWKKIDKDLINLYNDNARADSPLMKYVTKFFTHVLPLMGGFGGCFYYALKYA
mmetsp:Transcript_11542/g.11520  ORF Transcript_11542/g.11520 Transcript_11542/m.11520 type:complete len:101 (-) Transcript_11542:39-341(-)